MHFIVLKYEAEIHFSKFLKFIILLELIFTVSENFSGDYLWYSIIIYDFSHVSSCCSKQSLFLFFYILFLLTRLERNCFFFVCSLLWIGTNHGFGQTGFCISFMGQFRLDFNRAIRDLYCLSYFAANSVNASYRASWGRECSRRAWQKWQ